jgi:catechol 2,3-dioxygenase-like lactoylglutathione lyase family enzyme
MTSTQVSTQYTTGHIGLNVSNLARSKRFYQDVFGFDLAGESNDGDRAFAFLTQNNLVVLTLWQQSKGIFAADRPGLHHLSFQVNSIDQVKEAEQQLRKLGVVIHYDGVTAHAEGAQSGGVYFDDPDGIRLEIFAATGADQISAPKSGAPACGLF